MTVESFERLFSMSAFEAMRTIRRYRTMHPGRSIHEVVALIQSVEPDAATYDYEAGEFLDHLVPSSIDGTDPPRFYRACIDATIPRNSIWSKILLRGRRALTDKLERNEEQCFRAADLLRNPPTAEITEWWYRTMGAARVAGDQEKLRRAREAEQRTFDRERLRLRSIGIDLEPVLMAIEDNAAGYDVLSYNLGVSDPVNLLIEVKSTIASPIRFFLTRNEWNTAVKYGSNYLFHVWDLNAERLYERSVADVMPHVPADSGRGRWASVEIPIMSS